MSNYIDLLGQEWILLGDTSLSTTNTLIGRSESIHIPATLYSHVVTKGNMPSLAFGKNDFTFEFWLYLPSVPTCNVSILGTTCFAFGFNSTNQLYVYDSVISSNLISASASTAITLNTWTHVALVRTGTNHGTTTGITTLYLNGISVASATDSTNYVITYNYYNITTDHISSCATEYYLDLIRPSKSAIYTANFTPPTSYIVPTIHTFTDYAMTLHPLVYYQLDGTYLQDIVGGFDASISGTENTDYQSNISLTGDTLSLSLQPLTSTYNLTQSNYPTYNLNNITVQVVFKSNSSTSTGLLAGLMSHDTYPTYPYTYDIYVGTDYKCHAYVYDTSASQGIDLATSYIINDLDTHIAILTMDDDTAYLYVDGELISYHKNITTVVSYTLDTLAVGIPSTYVSGQPFPSTYFDGLISDVCFYNKKLSINEIQTLATLIGKTPTISEQTYEDDPYLDNVVLHASFNGDDTDVYFTDDYNVPFTNMVGSTTSPYIVTNPKLSNLITKFGNTSLYFQGAASKNVLYEDKKLTLGSNDFTIECWVYLTKVRATFLGLWNDFDGTTQNASHGIVIYSGTNQQYFRVYDTNSGTDILVASSTTFPLNEWIHLALVRYNGILTLYQNGVNVASATCTTNFDAYYCLLGGYSVYMLNGYMDEVRITKGIARYHGNFTIPSLPFQKKSALTYKEPESDIYKGMVVSELHFDDYVYGATKIIDQTNVQWTTVSGGLVSDQWAKYNGKKGLYIANNNKGISTTNAGLKIGTNDFCIEMWFISFTLPQGAAGYSQGLISQQAGSDSTQFFLGLLYSTSPPALTFQRNNAKLLTSSPCMLGTWNHVAVCRINGISSLFLNGRIEQRVADTFNYTYATNITAIGYSNTGTTNSFNGVISDFRFTIGNGRYDTDSFIPPWRTSVPELPYSQNTVSLLHFEGRPESTIVYDEISGNNWTTNDQAKLTADNKKYGQQSLIAGQTVTSYIQSINENYILNDGDFTIEFWALILVTGQTQVLFSLWDDVISNSGNDTMIQIYINSSNIIYYQLVTNSYNTGASPRINRWQHYALVKSNKVYYLYLDGHLIYSSTTDYTHTDKTITLGTNGRNSGILQIDEFRLTKEALYTGTYFDPPEKEFSLDTDPYSNHISSLLHFDGSNSDVNIIDQVNANIWTITGTANIDTSTSAISGSSLYVGGSGSWISTPLTQNMTLGAGDFTVECWINTTLTTETYFIDCFNSNYATFQIGLYNNCLTFYSGSSTGRVITGNTAINDGTWHHIAVVRYDNSLSVYVDGQSDATPVTSTINFNYINPSYVLAIGAQVNTRNATYDYTGYIDEFRLTQGVARYTSNFNPPLYQGMINRVPYSSPTPSPTLYPSPTPTLSITPTPSLQLTPNQYALDLYNFMVSYYSMDYNLSDELGRNSLSGTYTAQGSGTAIQGGNGFANSTSQNISSGVVGITWGTNQPEITLGCWVYIGASLPTQNGTLFQIASTYNTSGEEKVNIGFDNANQAIYGNIYNAATSSGISAESSDINLNAWNHVILSSDGDNINFYINGQLGGTTAITDYMFPTIGNIGLGDGVDHASYTWLAPLDECVVVNKALTQDHVSYLYNGGLGKDWYQIKQDAGIASTYVDPYYQKYVKSLMHFEGDDQSTDFIDEKNNEWTMVGTPVISTNLYKFGSSSLYLDGSSYLTIPYSPDFSVKPNDDFTIECWINLQVAPPSGTLAVIFSLNGDSTMGNGYSQIRIAMSMVSGYTNEWQMLISSSGGNSWSSSTNYQGTWALNTWYHVAMTKSHISNNTYANYILYVNGINVFELDGQPNKPYNYNQLSQLGPYFNGYIDEFRFTQGIARYTSNFIPSSYSFYPPLPQKAS